MEKITIKRVPIQEFTAEELFLMGYGITKTYEMTLEEAREMFTDAEELISVNDKDA